MKKIGLSLLAVGSLSACATGMTNQQMISRTVMQYPIETAMLNIYNKAYSDEVQALVDGQRVTVVTQVTPKGAMRFNNKSVQGAEVVTITKINEQIADKTVGINYFTLAPLVFHGFTSDIGEYSVTTQTTPIPKTAKIGDASAYLTEHVYSDSSQRKAINTYTQTWSLKQASPATAWLCIENSENLLLSYDPEGTSTECYEINVKGEILASNVTLNGDETIVFKSK